MNYYSSNLEALLQRNIALAKKTHAITSSGACVTEARNGQPNLMEQDSSGAWNPLHSAYDPMREAEGRAGSVTLPPGGICIVLGFGAGYVVEALTRQETAATVRFLVVEPNPSVFKEALRCRDLRSLLSAPNIDFHIGTDLELLAEVWEALPLARRMQSPRVVQHFASVKSHALFFQSALELIKRQVCKSSLDFDNLANSSRRFFDNLLENLLVFLPDPGVKELEGLFKDVPAILISAGPSLDKNVHLLAAMADHATLIATDAAVRPLLAQGIEPHFIVSVDPGPANYQHLKGVQLERSRLVFEATVYSETIRQFEGRRFVAFLAGSFYQFMHDQIEEKGRLSGWGSVSTLAFDFARQLGCDPIIFVGQDLSFTGGRTYCQNITYQSSWLENLGTEEDLQARLSGVLQGEKPIPAVDIFSGETLTTTRLLSYALWLSEELQTKGDIRCINATEGGILSSGTELLSLKEAVFRHCQKEVSIWQRLPTPKRRPFSTRKLESFVKRTLRHVAAMRTSCETYLETLNRWSHPEFRKPGVAASELPQLWWEQFQKRTFRHTETARILEFFNQPAIREFLQGAPGAHPDIQNEWGRYRQFVCSVLDCAQYLESGLGGLSATLGTRRILTANLSKEESRSALTEAR